jgi:hypothetical protein
MISYDLPLQPNVKNAQKLTGKCVAMTNYCHNHSVSALKKKDEIIGFTPDFHPHFETFLQPSGSYVVLSIADYRSLFGWRKIMNSQKESGFFVVPVIIILVGLYFLLQNLGIAPNLDWAIFLRLGVPILLILFGIQTLGRNVSGGLGRLLNLGVLVGVLGVFAGIFLLSNNSTFANIEILSNQTEIQREPVAYPLDGATDARVNIDFNSAGADIYALPSNSDQMLAGAVSFTGELKLSGRNSNENISLDLDTRANNGIFFFGNWDTDFQESDRWDIGLSPAIPLNLTLDMSSGVADANLTGLNLDELRIDGGSGKTTLTLPTGNYDVNYDGGSGFMDWKMPASGNLTIHIDGGSGRINLTLPATLEARVELDNGSGAFIPDNRFTQINNDNDNEVWQTDGYDTVSNRALFVIDQGSGAIEFTTAQGR